MKKVYLYRCSWDQLWDHEKREKFEKIGVQWCLDKPGEGIEKLLITTEKITFSDIFEPTQIQRPLFKFLGEGNIEDFRVVKEGRLITRTELAKYVDDWLAYDRISKLSTSSKNGLEYISNEFEESLFIISIIEKYYNYDYEFIESRIFEKTKDIE